jgi:hypothetical protein
MQHARCTQISLAVNAITPAHAIPDVGAEHDHGTLGAIVLADLRDTAEVLSGAGKLLDFTRPWGWCSPGAGIIQQSHGRRATATPPAAVTVL